MPVFTIQAPDGRKIKIKANDQATAVRGAKEYVGQYPSPGQVKTPSPALSSAQQSASAKTLQGGPGPQQQTGLGQNIAAGLNSSIYGAVGASVDLTRMGANFLIDNANATVDRFGRLIGTNIPDIPTLPDGSLGGSASIRDGFTKIGVPDPRTITPSGPIERIGRGAAEGVGYAMAPQMGLAALAKAGMISPKVLPWLESMFGGSKSAGDIAGNAVAGGFGGAGAVAAAEAVPEQYKSAAALGGGIVGGGVGAAMTMLPRMAGAGTKVAGEFLRPLTAGGREQMAGHRIFDAADNPSAVVSAIRSARENIRGSKPTTFQQTGDMGLGSLERAVSARNPAEFMQRRADQNAAQTNAIENIQPTGAAEQVVGAVRQHLDGIDAKLQAAIDGAAAAAQKQSAAIGPGMVPDAAGDAMRTTLEAARAAAKTEERAMWSAVDPDGTLALPASATKQQAAVLKRDTPMSAKPPSGEEAAIMGLIRSYDDVIPFSEITALQSRLKSEMRAERMMNGETPAYRRMSMLSGAVQSDLESAIAGGVRGPGAGSMPQGVAPKGGTSVFTPSGRQIDVEYQVVDADDLIPSHLDDMQMNPKFPPALQPRNRTRAASEIQISRIASELQPERLGVSASSAEGAPIIGPDNMVESGNARVLALRRAYQRGGPSAAAYRKFLADQGFDVGNVKTPVLVRRRKTQMDDADRVRFAQEANASPTLAMSAGERAKSDAGRLTDDLLQQYRGGDVSSPENRDFVRAFLGSVAERGEEGAFTTGKGGLALDGERRLKSALLAAAYDEPSLIEALIEVGDENIQAFGRSLQDLAGDVARVKSGIKAGRIEAGADVSVPLVEAARMIQSARRRGIKISAAVAQQDAFDALTAAGLDVLVAAYGPALNGRLSRGRFETILASAIAEAELQTADARLFGGSMSLDEILAGANARYAQRNGQGQSVPDAAWDFRPGDGEGGAPGSGPRTAAAGQGRPEASDGAGVGDVRQALSPNFDAQALSRLKAAGAATKTRAETFDNKTLGPLRRRAGTTSPYDMPSGAVPGRIFFAGPKSYDAVKTFLRASPDGRTAVQDYAINRVRAAALRDDGTIDPGRLASWRRSHADALRAFPDLDKALSSAGGASEALATAAVARKQTIDAAQSGVLARILNLTEPGDVTRSIGAIFSRQDAAGQMMRLRAAVRGNPDAAAGLRKAVVDFMLDRFVSNTEAATSGIGNIKSDGFQTFVSQKKGALKAAGFTEGELDLMDAVALDLQQANRSIAAVKLPGGSNTAQDVLATRAGDTPATMLTRIALASAGSGAGAGILGGPLAGAAATLGTALVGALRQQGLSKVDDLVRDAMLNPEIARLLLMKAGAQGAKKLASSLAQRYARGISAGVAAGQDERKSHGAR